MYIYNEYIFIYAYDFFFVFILRNPQYFKRLIIQFKTIYIFKKQYILISQLIKIRI